MMNSKEVENIDNTFSAFAISGKIQSNLLIRTNALNTIN